MQILVAISSIPLLNSVIGIISEVREGWIIGYLDNMPRATELLNFMKPNVLIFDFQLWVSSKLDVIERIKKVVPYSKVVVVTGETLYPEYRNKSLDLGADLFFNLNHELDEFCRTLKQLDREFAVCPDMQGFQIPE